jgi:hypothetical protein
MWLILSLSVCNYMYICYFSVPRGLNLISQKPIRWFGAQMRKSLGRVPATDYSSYDFVKFTSNTFNHIKRIYKSTDCSGNITSSLSGSGSYSLPKVDVAGTFPVNLTLTTKMGGLFDAEAVAAANAEPLRNGCGFSDWSLNTAKNLTNSQCSSDTVRQFRTSYRYEVEISLPSASAPQKFR